MCHPTAVTGKNKIKVVIYQWTNLSYLPKNLIIRN